MWILYIITHLFYLFALIVICVDNGKLRRKTTDLQDKLSSRAIDYVIANKRLHFYKYTVDVLEQQLEDLKSKIKNETN